MKKSDLQALYREIKRRKHPRKNTSSTTKNSSGCQSCGKTTWKPTKS